MEPLLVIRSLAATRMGAEDAVVTSRVWVSIRLLTVGQKQFFVAEAFTRTFWDRERGLMSRTRYLAYEAL